MYQARHTRRRWPWAVYAWLLASTCVAAPLQVVMQSFPPFAYEDNGQASGAFPDLIRAACASLHLVCTQSVLPWRRALRMAEQGEADAISAIQALPERAAAFYLSPPLIQSSYALLVQADNPLSGAELTGYTLAAYGPSATSQAMDTLARQKPGIQTRIEIDNLAVLRKLHAGRYPAPAAALINMDVARHLIAAHGMQNLRVAAELDAVVYCIGLSRKSVSAADAARIFTVLERFARDGTLRAIAERHGVQAIAAAGPRLAFQPQQTRRQP